MMKCNIPSCRHDHKGFVVHVSGNQHIDVFKTYDQDGYCFAIFSPLGDIRYFFIIDIESIRKLIEAIKEDL